MKLLSSKVDLHFHQIGHDPGINLPMFGVLPELVGRWYSSPWVVKSTCEQSEISKSDDDDDDNALCYCGRTAAAGDMIRCDNKSCPIMWFHMNCLNTVNS